MRFFLDANLPRSAVHALARLGHEVEFARDVGMAEASDEAIAERVRETRSALITRDTDFADIRRYPPENYAGIVVLRLPDDAIGPEIARVLETFVSDVRFRDHLAGRLAIVEGDRVRFRPPLQPIEILPK